MLREGRVFSNACVSKMFLMMRVLGRFVEEEAQQLGELRQELKEWERDFLWRHGRKPTKVYCRQSVASTVKTDSMFVVLTGRCGWCSTEYEM